MRYLDRMGVPYRVVIEEQERAAYAGQIDPARLLILDPVYQRDYDACMALAPGQSKGSGPARNFIWDHAAAEGSGWHWIMDDNIRGFYRLNRNLTIPVADGTIFRCMEDFALRYRNLVMLGPHWRGFVVRKNRLPPFILNTRLFSCILIRNDIPFRWRCRYNEDLDLSLRILKAGLATVQFYAFMHDKLVTQTARGGNTDAFYADEGTMPKSRMIVDLHPDVARVVWKFGRWHHHVDYSGFRQKLMRRDDIVIPQGVDNYGMVLKHIEPAAIAAERTRRAA